MVRCQPCTVDYDFLVQTETQAMDARHIVNHKMIGRGLDMKTNSWRKQLNGTYPFFGRLLSEYQNIPQQLFKNITEHYKRDFEVYGYGFKQNADGSVLTQWKAAENNGD